MPGDIHSQVEAARNAMKKAVQHLEAELSKVRAGKATPQLLEGVSVDYYGSMTPLSQVANINSQDARTLVIKPWEKSMLEPIEKAIMAANLGVNPVNDGEIIRVNIPPLTEERRQEYVKKAKVLAEQSRVSIRNLRREANEHIKKFQKDGGVAEDVVKNAESQIQKATDEYIQLVDKHVAAKEKEIVTV